VSSSASFSGEPVVPVERFINGYQSRSERLADFIRRMRICEEKSSGIDKVIHAVELYQLPVPYFRVGHRRTIVILFGPRDFETMDREDRVRACYQHTVLKWVMSERMTNQSLRNRFHLPESKSAIVSQVIAFSIEAGVIKPDETKGISQHG
jgi:ATP-dependent DNA helicase RecG